MARRFQCQAKAARERWSKSVPDHRREWRGTTAGSRPTTKDTHKTHQLLENKGRPLY